MIQYQLREIINILYTNSKLCENEVKKSTPLLIA
jgi:hypothetical protein